MTNVKSHNHHTSLGQLDALEQSRRIMLLAVIITSNLWLLPLIIQNIFEDSLSRGLYSVLVIAGILGGLVWMVSMFKYHRFQMRVLEDPELRERLDDERVLEIRREAIYRGWFVLVVALALGVGAAPFFDLPDQAVLLSLLLLGVNAPIVFFLILDRG